MKSGEVDREGRNRVPTRRILVIAYGNPMRGDDALGQVVAGKLARRYQAGSRVEVVSVQQLTFDLAEKLASSDLAILIDAMEALPEGALYTREIQPSQELSQPFSHYLTPEELLGVCQNLYHAAPETILTGIKSTSFEVGASLSLPVLEQIPRLIAQIEKVIAGK